MKNKLYSLAPVYSNTAWKPAALLFAGIIAALPVQALVHLNPNPALYENRPTTAPANTMPWDNVGKLTNASGSSISGSVVSLHGKYVLTADHVSITTHVTFDGVTLYAVDSSFTAVKFGTTGLPTSNPNYRKVDMKLFKLVEDPGLEALNIVDYTNDTHAYAPLYIVGWGQGKSTTQTAARISGNDRDWDWGGSRIKRWGTNSYVVESNSPTVGYVYGSLRVRLESSPLLTSEAGLASSDSGGASFTYKDGQWYLVGVATAVSVSSFSRFSADARRHSNYWADLRLLSDSIYAAAPVELEPVLEPEPDVSVFEGWLLANGLEGADAALDADPDGDGIVNLSEFAYGTNPTVHDSASAPALAPDGSGGFVFRYQLSKVATGISVDVLHSADLINWSAAPGTPAVVTDTDDFAVYELAVYPGPTTQRFYTVKVTLASATEE